MTTTTVPTCTDDLLAEIERVTEPDAIHMIAHSDMDALLARLHAAEKDAGRYRDLLIKAGEWVPHADKHCKCGDCVNHAALVDYIYAAMQEAKQ